MNSKITNKLFCILLTIALILPCSAVSFADDVEDEDVLRASNLEEYIEATDPADPVAAMNDEIFSACRLKVKRELDSLEGAVEGVSYRGDTLLRFGSVAETKRAYARLCKEYGEDNVIVDIPLFTVDSVSKPVGWGTEFMNIGKEIERQVQKHGQNAGKVTIAVIDSGIDSSHEIFDGRMISAYSCDIKDFSPDITDEDKNSHGTSVAGIISESAPDNVELMIIKTYTDGNYITLVNVEQAIEYAVKKDADVINLSMSSSPSLATAKNSELVKSSVADMEDSLRYATEKGVIICASSGNDGGNMDTLHSYPAVSSYTIAVGSVDESGERSYFSNYGTRLDFCAPGGSLEVAVRNSNPGNYTSSTEVGSGTSFATPYIATCCAFVKMDNAKAGNQEAIRALSAICVDYGVAGWDRYYGWGMPKYGVVAKKTAQDDSDAKARAVKSVKVGGSKVTAASIRAAIAAAGGRNEYVTELVLGKGVKKISKKALKGTKVKTIVIKSKKLKKKSVKGSLKGSSVTKIKVKVGSKKTNKKYVRKYKPYFTKKNAGRKVKVTR